MSNKGQSYIMYVAVVILTILMLIVIVQVLGGEGFGGQLLNSTLERIRVIYKLLVHG